MGQIEIVNFLSKHPTKWYNIKNLSKYTHTRIASITMSCKRLRKYNIVNYSSSINKGYKSYIYKYKKGIK